MKISLEWLSEYLDVAPIKADLKGVLARLTMRGLEVEAIHDLSKGFEKVVVGHVEDRQKHPNADRLSVCKVNTGKEVLQIVCGAANVRAGLKVAVSLPGAELPNGMKIQRGKIRDVESCGMICSESELGMSTESAGIIELPANAPIGENLAKFLGREDIVFEVNVTPNRGDALSHIGIARELAPILGQKINLPGSKVAEASNAVTDKVNVTLHNPAQAPDLCLQYHGRYFEGVKVASSPMWLQKRLLAVGLRPINNIVDVTNYVLMEYGQPLHAFDYSKVQGGDIQVRLAKAGEKLPLLDKTDVVLSAEDLVIADSEKPIALAGVMGGGNSEVSESTTNLLLEAAQFSSSTVRKTARRHQKKSDSSYRFERQVDARAVSAAMERAAHLILETAGGKVYRGAVSKFSPMGEKLVKGSARAINTSAVHVNSFLGTSFSEAEIVSALKQIGFECSKQGNEISVSVPSCRPDVTIVEDVYEEILRVQGYDKVEARVPLMSFIPDPVSAAETRSKSIEKLKAAFALQGFCEAVNFAFASEQENAVWGAPATATKSVKLKNPLNEDLSTLRTSLLGGLMKNLMTGLHHQQKDLRLFEVRPVFTADTASITGLKEEWMCSAVFLGRAYTSSLAASDHLATFFEAKGVLENVFDTLGARGCRFGAFESTDPRFHPAQAATVLIGRGPAGVVARLHPKLETELKIRQPVFLCEFSLDRLLELAKADKKFSPISRFPKVERDLSLLVPNGVVAERITQCVLKAGKPLLESVVVVDLYSGDKIPQGSFSLSISMTLAEPSRTLEDKEVDGIMQRILSSLDKDLGVKLRIQ